MQHSGDEEKISEWNPYCPPYLGSGSPYCPAPYGDYGPPYLGSGSPYCPAPYGESDSSLLDGVLRAATDCRPLRIIHVGQSLVRVGGIETCIKGLFRFLDPRRLQITRCIVTPTEEFDAHLARELGVPVEIGGAERVRAAALEADILLCWGPRELGVWLADCRPRLCVFVAHGEGKWTRWILEGSAPIIDHVVAVSQRVKDQVCQGFAATVISNGVDTTHLAQTRSRAHMRAALGFRVEDFVLGFVGRFAAEKRAHLLIEAVAGLPPHFKALLVGRGYLRGQLMDLANERIPGRYAFATAVNDVGDYYAALDALCLPSSEEGYALVILEAMLCGRPVIATPVGCVPEIFQDKVNGLIVEGSVDSIRAAALRLHRHPAWAAAVAAEGRAYAEEHGHARAMAKRYEELLLRLWREKQV
jgi:glycosyltransferase involved in cell wall biosynthesis